MNSQPDPLSLRYGPPAPSTEHDLGDLIFYLDVHNPLIARSCSWPRQQAVPDVSGTGQGHSRSMIRHGQRWLPFLSHSLRHRLFLSTHTILSL